MIGQGFGDSLASAFVAFFVISLIAAAIGGWALIEGAIWLWHHLSIGWLP